MTEIDGAVLEQVKTQFYDQIPISKKLDTPGKLNLIPVQIMKNEEMGISLKNLSVVIHRIFNQIYGLTNRKDVQTQTQYISYMASDAHRKMQLSVRNQRNQTQGSWNSQGVYLVNQGLPHISNFYESDRKAPGFTDTGYGEQLPN